MTRDVHLQWCKERALEYVDSGDLKTAMQSMFSDLGKHSELENHPGIRLGTMMLMAGLLSTPEQIREFIIGFN